MEAAQVSISRWVDNVLFIQYFNSFSIKFHWDDLYIYFIQLIIIIHRFCVCKHACLLKCICKPQISNQYFCVLAVIHRHVQSSPNWSPWCSCSQWWLFQLSYCKKYSFWWFIECCTFCIFVLFVGDFTEIVHNAEVLSNARKHRRLWCVLWRKYLC